MGTQERKNRPSLAPAVVSLALVPLLCAGAGMLLVGPRTAVLDGLSLYQEQEAMQVADREGPAAQEGQGAGEQEAPQAASHGLTEEQIEYYNEKEAANPARIKVLREGDAEAVPLEDVDNIEYLSSLPQDNIDRSLLYIGDFLAGRGYDPQTVKISILEGIEDYTSGWHYPYQMFFFQVEGEDTVFSVSVADLEYDWAVSVHDTADQRFLSIALTEYKQILARRGFL